MFFVYLIVALAAGVALATQSAINTQLAKAMSGEAVIATFISFAVGTIFLFFIALAKTDLWGQSIHDSITTLVEINWWGTWCYRRVHNRFASTEIRHYGDVIFYHCRTTNYGNNYRSFWSYRYADPRSKYHKNSSD